MQIRGWLRAAHVELDYLCSPELVHERDSMTCLMTQLLDMSACTTLLCAMMVDSGPVEPQSRYHRSQRTTVDASMSAQGPMVFNSKITGRSCHLS